MNRRPLALLSLALCLLLPRAGQTECAWTLWEKARVLTPKGNDVIWATWALVEAYTTREACTYGMQTVLTAHHNLMAQRQREDASFAAPEAYNLTPLYKYVKTYRTIPGDGKQDHMMYWKLWKCLPQGVDPLAGENH